MGIDAAEHAMSFQCWCGLIALQNTFYAVQYVSEWFTYVQDARIITDAPSLFGSDEGVREHRHDQSVCSLLSKKWKVEPRFSVPRGILEDGSGENVALVHQLLRLDGSFDSKSFEKDSDKSLQSGIIIRRANSPASDDLSRSSPGDINFYFNLLETNYSSLRERLSLFCSENVIDDVDGLYYYILRRQRELLQERFGNMLD